MSNLTLSFFTGLLLAPLALNAVEDVTAKADFTYGGLYTAGFNDTLRGGTRPWPFRADGEQRVVIGLPDKLDPIATVIVVKVSQSN